MPQHHLSKEPLVWHYRDKDYPLAVTDLEIELLFQTRHERWCRSRVELARDEVSYEDDLQAFQERLFSNEFAFGTWLSRKWLFSDAGMLEYLLLKFQKAGTKEITREFLQQLRRTEKEAWVKLGDSTIRADFPLWFKGAEEAPDKPE